MNEWKVKECWRIVPEIYTQPFWNFFQTLKLAYYLIYFIMHTTSPTKGAPALKSKTYLDFRNDTNWMFFIVFLNGNSQAYDCSLYWHAILPMHHAHSRNSLCTICFVWSKTSLISGSAGGTEMGGSSHFTCKLGTFFIMSLSLSVPIFINF